MPKKPLFIIGLENRLNNPTFPLAAALFLPDRLPPSTKRGL